MCYTISTPRFLWLIMGWEQRGKKFYYYTKKRIGKRVISEYVSCAYAQYAAILDELAKENRDLERLAEQRQRDQHAEIDTMLKANEADLKRQLAELMKSAGYHQHKGTWRKKRKAKN